MKERVYIIEMKKRKQELERGIRKAEMFLRDAPEGRIRTSMVGRWPSYYYVTDKTGHTGQYIKRGNAKTAELLAQKEYATKYIHEARSELDVINGCIAKCQEYGPEKSYTYLHRNKQLLLQPYQLDDAEFIDRWLTNNRNCSSYKDEEKIYPTKNGEMVRSKSEAMIADVYYELGIPYIYEKELVLKNGTKKYPDFTLLDISSKKEIYHEHFGLLDNDNYRYQNLKKIEEYRKNGVYVGRNLIITHEAEGSPLNINSIRNWVKELFL